MAGLFQKARMAALSSAHALLDKIIDLNSVGAVKQYVRDLENALEDLEDAAATEAGHVRTVQRDCIQLQSQMKELNQNIDFILSDNNPANDHLAKPLEARLIGLEQRTNAKDEEIDIQHRNPLKPLTKRFHPPGQISEYGRTDFSVWKQWILPPKPKRGLSRQCGMPAALLQPAEMSR